ncbi:LysR family transcriptional regulator [Actinoallomurus sp. NPDC050550]|uniref:LysR family transcriptional regulator n=1 Tax=Actinoallomurus sp. NPDC050550 TaxID=3154937 RepID=UPI0033DF279A
MGVTVPENLDLNLLRVFDALMDAGSVTAAAEQLHLSPPATSRALTRLRRAMNDPILVRAGRGLVPTPFALRSAPRVRALLEGAAELVTDATGSEPRTWRRSFAVRINDGLAPVLVPRLIGRITAEAPGVSLRLVAQNTKDPDALRDGSVDLDIAVADPPAPDVYTQTLFADHFVAVVSAQSTLGRARRLTVAQLCRYPHISVSRKGRARGPLDDTLETLGRTRRVVAVVPTYAAASLLALEDDVIVLIPRVMARHLVDRGVPVRWHEVPLDLPRVTVDQRWHRRLDSDRPSQWLRGQVVAALEHLVGDDARMPPARRPPGSSGA